MSGQPVVASRRAPIVLGTGGAFWCAWGVVQATTSSTENCTTSADVSGDALFAIAGAVTSLGLIQLAGLSSGPVRFASFASALGAFFLGVGNLVEHCVYPNLWLVFVFGALLTLVAGAVLGGALALSWSRKRHLGVLVLLGALAPGLLAEHGGFLTYGLAWLGFAGLWLLEPRDEFIINP